MARFTCCALALVAAMAAAACSRQAETAAVELQRTPTAEELQYGPLYVDIGVQGRFLVGRPWSMHVEPDGRTAVFLANHLLLAGKVLEPSVQVLDFGREGLQHIRQTLITERFFELEPTFGRPVTDGSLTWIDIRLGDYRHRVELLFWNREEIRTGRAGARGTVEGLDRAWRVYDAITAPLPADWAAIFTPAFMQQRGEEWR